MKTRSKRVRSGTVSLAKVAARVALAVCLALSFFASLVPLRVSAHDGSMACCAGQAGHCNSGVLASQSAKPAPKPKPQVRTESEPMCGLKPAAGDKGQAVAKDAGLTDGDKAVAETTSDGSTVDEITVLAAPSEVIEPLGGPRGGKAQDAQDAAKSSQPEAQHEATASLQGASLTKPCPTDCRAGTTGVVRQPRPRETVLLAKNTRGSLPERANWKPYSLQNNLAASAALKCSRPRGPPLPS